MNPMNAMIGMNMSQDILMQAIKMSGAGGMSPAGIPMNFNTPRDGISLS